MKHFILAALLFATSCATPSSETRKVSEQRQLVRDQLSSEISLKEDRHKLDDLRKDVPADKKAANDELAFSLNQTSDLKENPNRIRERFQHAMERKRRDFSAKVQKIKGQYQKDETTRRDNFNREQNKKRSDFRSKKKSSTDTHDFYAQLDRDRLDFFSKERDKRADFDDEIRNQTRDFNDYMRAKHDEFTEQMRIYNRRYEEARKAGKLETAAPPANAEENPKLPEPPYDTPAANPPPAEGK